MVKGVHPNLLCASPDLLWNSVALTNLMRLSVTKAAHAAMSSVAWREIRVWLSVVEGKALKTSFWNFPLLPTGTNPAGTISAGGELRLDWRGLLSVAGGTCCPLGTVELGLPLPSRAGGLGACWGAGAGSVSVVRRNSRTRDSISYTRRRFL